MSFEANEPKTEPFLHGYLDLPGRGICEVLRGTELAPPADLGAALMSSQKTKLWV